MGVYRSKPYRYGIDIDNKNYTIKTDVEITSDISGEEIGGEDIYEYNGKLCTLEELYDLLNIELKTANSQKECCFCDKKISKGESYYEIKEEDIHKDCLKEYLYENYNISEEKAIEKYEYTYEDYLADEADCKYHERFKEE